MADTLTGPPPSSQLIGIADLSRWLSRSVASLRRDDAAGRLPAPVRIGGSKKWRVADVERWLTDGCPTRTASTFKPNQGDR